MRTRGGVTAQREGGGTHPFFRSAPATDWLDGRGRGRRRAALADIASLAPLGPFTYDVHKRVGLKDPFHPLLVTHATYQYYHLLY